MFFDSLGGACQVHSAATVEVTYLLLPIASIAEAGGPMKVMPASAHFLAKCGFSLNCLYHQRGVPGHRALQVSYKSISRMYALTAPLLCNLYYPVSIKIRRRISEVDSKGGAERMLRTSIWIGVEGSCPYAVLRSCAADTARACQLGLSTGVKLRTVQFLLGWQ